VPFELPPLPYAPNALEPYTSAKTIALHYGKHHRAYVTKLNELIAGTPFETMSLEAVIRTSQGMSDAQAIFNNAAQHWNHSKFWNSMRPAGPRKMPAALERRLVAQFGSVDAFKSEFVAQGLSQFGSGWVWLVEKDDSLHVQRTSNAMTPLIGGGMPLLVCDVWEHAYYVDYENRRADFLKAFVDHLADWDAVVLGHQATV
jgi:superoxide dismutase, Fe-Mn family